MTAQQQVGPSPRATRWRRRPLAWRRRGFRQLARAWFFTNVADSALVLMAAVWVKELTGSDVAAALTLGVVGIATLLAPVIGQAADLVSRRRLLVVANLVMAPVVLSLLLVDSASEVWWVLVVVLLYGAMNVLTGAAQSGLLRDLLDDSELASGNGVLATIDTGLRLLSPLLGAGLYAAAGATPVITLTAGAFLVTGTLLVHLEVEETPPTPAADREGRWREVTAGFRHLRRTPPLGRLTVAFALGFGATGLVNAVVFPAMEQGLGVRPELIGVFVSLQGIGAVLAGLTAATLILRFGERRTLGLGLLMVAAGLVPVAGTSAVGVGAGMVVVGLGVPWVVVAHTTLRQRLTPPTLQGRTAAATNLAINLPQSSATFAAAAAMAVVDYRLLVVGTSLLVLVAAGLSRASRDSLTA